MWLEEITYSTDNNWEGKFKFQNDNYFSVKWSDPDVSLYWVTSNYDAITTKCAGGSTNGQDACNWINGACSIKIGEFNNNDKFNTKSQSSKHETIEFTQSAQQLSCSANMITFAAYQGLQQTLLSKGTIKAEGDVRNFGKMSVSSTYYY